MADHSFVAGAADAPARRALPCGSRRLQLFVEGNLERPIRLHDLATRAALSPLRFARAFTTSAGMTPRTFVEHRRIERAKRLLTGSIQPLADVAAASGFGAREPPDIDLRRKAGSAGEVSTPAIVTRCRRPESLLVSAFSSSFAIVGPL